MKLVIDLQGAQSASKGRGIGRYSLALAKAMARQCRDHEVWIALNEAFPDTIDPLRNAFVGTLLPRERVVTWKIPTPVAEFDPANTWRRRAAEVLRESFLASLNPDIVHVSSMFEGFYDDAVTSAECFWNSQATAMTLHDLIPLAHTGILEENSAVELWYYRKLASTRRATLWLANSESSRQDAISYLNLPTNKVVNISAAADAELFANTA